MQDVHKSKESVQISKVCGCFWPSWQQAEGEIILFLNNNKNKDVYKVAEAKIKINRNKRNKLFFLREKIYIRRI